LETNIIKQLQRLYRQWSGLDPVSVRPMPLSGSYRQYYRITGENRTAIGVFNADVRENEAYFAFTSAFRAYSLQVPEILMRDDVNKIYLIADLGDETLFSFLSKKNTAAIFSEEILAYYYRIIEELPKFQVLAVNSLDFSYCYPRSSFDRQSMMWDLNYFKYYFLKLARIPFDEQKLEDDFIAFCNYLLESPSGYFMYRDFQSRNIMIYDNRPWFIDFQGGRKGALQYDIASLLYDAKAAIPQPQREALLGHYIETLGQYMTVDEKEFRGYFHGFVFIRILQAMGAYGFRGYYEKKEHFLQSIPFAVNNIRYLTENVELPVKLPELMKVLRTITSMDTWQKYQAVNDKLIVDICSFSYKNGLPSDHSGNGGGFVFDCRALPNPGRYEKYASLTGNDHEVFRFLEDEPAVGLFLENVFNIVDFSVRNYLERNFSHLMVSFGCTGGRHRSVYCARKLSEHLGNEFGNIRIQLSHREIMPS